MRRDCMHEIQRWKGRAAANYERVRFPARGFDGGQAGMAGYVGLASGAMLPGKGRHAMPRGDHIVIQSPDGGGLGEPRLRDAALVQRDLRYGSVTEPSNEAQQ